MGIVTPNIIANAAFGAVLELDKWFGGGTGPFGSVDSPGSCATGVDAIVIYAGNIINVLLVILVILAIILMVISGIKFINSGGQQKGVQEASQFSRDIILGLLLTFIFLVALSVLFAAFGPDQSELTCESVSVIRSVN